MLGVPLLEIAPALSQSGVSEIVLAPSAARHWGSAAGQRPLPSELGCWRESELPSGGGLLLRPEEAPLAGSMAPKVQAATNQRSSFDVESRRSSEYKLGDEMRLRRRSRISTARSLDAVVQRMRWNSEARKPASFVEQPVASAHNIWLTMGISSEDRAMGAGDLLQFMPEFVRTQHIAGRSGAALTEHRLVTVLFIVADMEVSPSGRAAVSQAALMFTQGCGVPLTGPSGGGPAARSALHSVTLPPLRSLPVLCVVLRGTTSTAPLQEHAAKFRDGAWTSRLQTALGKSIDLVEAQMGGATRQVGGLPPGVASSHKYLAWPGLAFVRPWRGSSDPQPDAEQLLLLHAVCVCPSDHRGRQGAGDDIRVWAARIPQQRAERGLHSQRRQGPRLAGGGWAQGHRRRVHGGVLLWARRQPPHPM